MSVLRDEACAAGTEVTPVSPDVAAAKATAIARRLTETETLPLGAALSRVLALAPRAAVAVPPFDNSAMDGYALRVGDLRGQGPWTLPVAGRIAAGHAPHASAAEGAALRIFTGAPVPAGFDAVVMQEHCRRAGDHVVVDRLPRMGDNIRRAGEDVGYGATLLQAGDALTPHRLALLAGAGIGAVSVMRKLRVALISTGSELREAGEPLGPGQIHNSNRVLISSMLAGLSWAETLDFGIVPDDRRELETVLRQAAAQCDVIVTTGGVSAGDEDHVAAVLRESGGTLEVVKVAMRPGKPVKIGLIGGALFAGLPGNPNAALVTFRRIALPAIRAAAGLRVTDPAWQPAVAGFRYAKRPGRTEFVPVRVSGRTPAGVPVVELLARGSSATLSGMALADGIALLPPENETIEPGATLRLEMF